jgi:EAL and modified HD-GYP domain-containing signal transduction protein
MSTNAFLARQPIVDSHHRLIGYELLFRHSGEARSAQIEDGLDAGIKVIANTLVDMGTEWLLKGSLAFINMDRNTLLSDFTSLLPKEKVVIDVLNSISGDDEVVARLQELKQMGFRFALDDYYGQPEADALLPHANFIKLDVLNRSPSEVAAAIKKVRAFPVILVAEKVETLSQYKKCRDAGFDYFQGYYFAHPETLTTKVINPAQATVLQLMEKVRGDCEVKDIELMFKKDPALTFKLLRYINSAGFGLSCEVQSIRHAVAILGLKPLYRWLTLLLVTAGNNPTTNILARTAIVRGRLCELLGGHSLGKSDQENLFVTGVFSLLDAMMDTTMEVVLERVVLPENIYDALLNRTGIYGPILALAEACETQDNVRIDDLALSLMLTPEQVNEAHLKAMSWAEQLSLDA